MSTIYLDDARNLKKKIKTPLLDVTITSPPYFDMKDYGHSNQLGFGQKYETYLEDLRSIFKDVYDLTKPTGSLWVIIDSFKRDGAVVPLPFDFAREVSIAGWKLQDIIIWKKDKTVPWSNKGSTRKIFEYVLFFSKGQDFKYYSERARETRDLKEWWIRYPERYSPSGKSLEEIWEFSIPTQGAWGDGYIKHFCPLPEELVRRIITLTTDEGDVVFDPFSGSGTVPAQAAFMLREYFGFELNPSYVEMFKTYLEKNIKSRQALYAASKNSLDGKSFSEKIINLRILKYGRVLAKKLKSAGVNITKLWVERLNNENSEKNIIASAKYVFFINDDFSHDQINDTIQTIISSPPLSKFGISPDFECVSKLEDFANMLPLTDFFTYSASNTHQYLKTSSKKTLDKKGFIFSSIALDINEEFYRSTK